MRFQNTICFLVVSYLLSACSTMPISGPENGDISRGAKMRIFPKSVKSNDSTSTILDDDYIIVDVNPDLIKKFNESPSGLNYSWPEMGVAENVKLMVGDILSISIYESSAGGLFIPIEAGIRPGNFVTLPNQIIDPDGYIFVPYAGKIKVNGRSAIEVSAEIEKRLQTIAIEPQIVINIIDRNSDISVLGAVNRASRYDINFAGERVLDAISKAGGPTGAGFDTRVSIQRGDTQYKMRLDEIVDNRQKNIYLHSGDTIFLENDPDIFSIFGAITIPGRYRFNSKSIFLSEAIAISGGLNDSHADPEEVFVYRHEYCPFVARLDEIPVGIVKPDFGCDAKKNTLPIIYNINLRDSNGYFLAQNFKMRSEDVVYVGNARATELVKLLGIVNSNAVTTINTRNAKD
jgi:polysaccharide biosynthesis/export protein